MKMSYTTNNLLFILLLSLFFSSCVHQERMNRYELLLNNKVGKAKKEDLNKVLGNPISCKQENVYQKCEYRTTAGRNYPTPGVFRKQDAMGPDLSPYEYFDVLHLFYDEERVLQEWQPVVVRP